MEGQDAFDHLLEKFEEKVEQIGRLEHEAQLMREETQKLQRQVKSLESENEELRRSALASRSTVQTSGVDPSPF